MRKLKAVISKLRNEVESKDLLNKNLNTDLTENRKSIRDYYSSCNLMLKQSRAIDTHREKNQLRYVCIVLFNYL